MIKAQDLSVRAAGEKGRGVFACAPIQCGEVIELCPLIWLDARPGDVLWYYAIYFVEIRRWALMLGYGSLYNHGLDPNADVRLAHPDNVEFVALRDIAVGEEIIFDYQFDGEPEFIPASNESGL